MPDVGWRSKDLRTLRLSTFRLCLLRPPFRLRRRLRYSRRPSHPALPPLHRLLLECTWKSPAPGSQILRAKLTTNSTARQASLCRTRTRLQTKTRVWIMQRAWACLFGSHSLCGTTTIATSCTVVATRKSIRSPDSSGGLIATGSTAALTFATKAGAVCAFASTTNLLTHRLLLHTIHLLRRHRRILHDLLHRSLLLLLRLLCLLLHRQRRCRIRLRRCLRWLRCPSCRHRRRQRQTRRRVHPLRPWLLCPPRLLVVSECRHRIVLFAFT